MKKSLPLANDFDYSHINSNAAVCSSKHPLFKTDIDLAIEEFLAG